MHRVLTSANIYRNSILTIIGYNLRNESTLKVKCQFCHQLLLEPINSGIRKRPKAKLNKKSKNDIKYSKVLEVKRDHSVKQIKVAVRNLKATGVTKFACSALDPLHKLNNSENSTSKMQDKPFNNNFCHSSLSKHKNSSLPDFEYTSNENVKEFGEKKTNKKHTSESEEDGQLISQNFVKDSDYLSNYRKELSDYEMQGFLDTDIDCDHTLLTGEFCDTKKMYKYSRVKENIAEDKYIECDKTDKCTSNTSTMERQKEYKAKKRKSKKSGNVEENDSKCTATNISKRNIEERLRLFVDPHIRLLCSLQMYNQANKILQHYWKKHKNNQTTPKVADINIYNTLLHGYASQGLLEDIQGLLSLISKCGLELNAQSYAALFECVERGQVPDKLSVLNSYLKQMQEKGLTLNDLMDKSKFVYDQRETVLNAIRRVEPNFEPQYTQPELDYDCPLLDKLKLHNVENRLGLLKSPSDGLLTLEDLRTKAKEQLEMEYAGEVEIESVAVINKDSKKVSECATIFKALQGDWRKKITESFKRSLHVQKQNSSVSISPVSLYPYLIALEVDQYVELTLNEINKLVESGEAYSPYISVLEYRLGKQVYQKYQQAQYRRNGYLENLERVYDEYCKWYLDRRAVDGSATPLNNRQAWQMLVHKHRSGTSLDQDENPWSVEMCNKIGKFLYNIIINDVKINVNVFQKKAKVNMMPVAYKVHRANGKMIVMELKPHPVLVQIKAPLSARHPTFNVQSELMPTRAPPVPWCSATTRGSFFVTSTPLMRLPFRVNGPQKRLEEAPPVQLYPVLDSLNHLSEVPWVINKRILDLQLEIFRAGGDKKLNIPQPASAVHVGSDGIGVGEGAATATRRRIVLNRLKKEMHALWCDALYKLSLANHYRDTVFWLPQNIDFRGRVYAVGPHVSVLGDDMARALLTLARGRPLGPHGLRWLKLHAINLTGRRKRKTLAQRLEYAESIIDKILDSADRPLDGEGWWKESEDPWQTLACCMEIANAMRSPNAAEYVCGLPIHQDGSCNGLQHYAALGADAAGAAAVNLTPADQPQDVYSEVAALVEKARAQDAAQGLSIAAALEGFVSRKVVKQTVMTTVYGVTRFGARLQIAKQLKDINDLPEYLVWPGSNYLVEKTLASLRKMFTSTKLIQDWFIESADVISEVCGKSVEWVTPLGLPVMQLYYKRGQATRVPLLDIGSRPCTMKQRNGFPPNFIHSLDSTHMMLTTLHCVAAGVTFVSVHDCFWTHPHTVDAMNKICREQFVALYKQDILKHLSQYWMKKYSYTEQDIKKIAKVASEKKRVNVVLQKVPPKGSFEIRSVLNSTYFFS